MIEIQHLTDSNFKAATAANLVMVDFFATWCGPCKIQAESLAEFAETADPAVLSIAKVNVDDAPDTAASLGIMSIPTIILFRNGEIVYSRAGTHSKEQLADLVKKFA